MSLWGWYRARRLWLKILLPVVLLPVALVALYVLGRSLQYASAEKDCGFYVPSTANVVVRAKGLEAHLGRIRETLAWRVIQRKLLRDPAIRKSLNDLLKENGAPTLDDLEDDRKPFVQNQDRVLGLLGGDAALALQVRASIPKASFCAIVRLKWAYYLAAPFARFAMPTEPIGGETCLHVRDEGQDFYAAFAGALALVSNDKALLEEALKRKGREDDSDRPVAARMVFEGSPGMLQIRKSIQDSGLFPYVKWETSRGLSFTADLKDATMLIDADFDRAEPLHAAPPPLSVRSWAPTSSSGFLAQNTGGADLIRWLRGVFPAGSKESAAQNVQGALQALEDGGLSEKVLPELKDGLAVMTGIDEVDGDVVPTLTLVLPSSNPKAAVDALNELVRKIAGSYGDSQFFSSEPVGGTVAYSWRWPKGAKIAGLAVPTYAALKDSVIIGNNKQFTLAAIRTESRGDGFEQTSAFRKLRSRWKELGFAAEPSLAGGFLQPPQLREALNGSLIHVARLTTPINSAQLRAEVEAELRRQGRPLTDAEVVPAYNKAFDAKIEEEEAALRRRIQSLDAVKWAAFDASTSAKGITVKLAVEFR